MTFSDSKVLIATLWERTSAKGNAYLSGFLGKARIVGFRGEPRSDGAPTWDIYLTPGREQEEGANRESAKRTTAPHRQSQDRPASGDRPFFDDPVDDIGRG
jgi:hypothetical protein